MSFYIRDISKTDRHFFKSNADLLVVQEYDPGQYKKLFKNIFVCDGLGLLSKVRTSKNKYITHNKDLYITEKINIEAVETFAQNRKYDSVEILIPETFTFSDIDQIVDKISLYFADLEINVGILISAPDYLIDHKNYLDKYGFYISTYVPESINIELEEELLKIDRLVSPNAKTNFLCFNSKINIENIPKIVKCKYKPILEESFKDKLIRYLDKSKKSNVEIYTNGGITRKLFSKILSGKDYNPKKDTICCLIIGMELCLDDALDLLNAAGYTLTNSLLSDVIIKKHITDKEFDIEIINEELDEQGLMMLGWKPRPEK